VNELTWRFAKKFRAADVGEVPKGPWDDEPDKIQWIDDATGLDCLIVRNPMGALCGYVGVPPEHPLYEVGYDAAYQLAAERGVSLQVHGGLTFADRCEPGEPIEGICHLGEHGATENPWWLGFDMAHAGDLSPGMAWIEQNVLRLPPIPGRYRDVSYAKGECTDLARQLAGIS